MFLIKSKAQAALEFLMTYGWAILVVLVAIGALAYFGVLSPERFLPSKCTLPAGIACTDFLIDGTTNTITVALRNGLGYDLIDVSIAAGPCGQGLTNTLNNGEQKIFTTGACSPVLAGGSKLNYELQLKYTNADSLLTHVVNGTITGRVVGSSTTSSSSVCQTADDDGLCDGLDLVFGEGYRAACCSEFSLCCS